MAPAAAANVGGVMEVLFAQRLADNEKKVRDKTLKKLKKYLSVRSSSGRGFSDDDALKIWKGLFYCMYMADKPLVQEELAEDISSFFHVFNNEKDCLCFIKASFVTFTREWNGIDIFRIDKFLMFIRKVLRQVFVYLSDRKWSLIAVTFFVRVLETTMICPDDEINETPMGLKLHLCDIILEELAKIGGEKLEHRIILVFLQPYFKVLALSKQKVYLNRVTEGIIHHLMRQSIVGVKHDEGLDDGEADMEVDDGSEEEEEDVVLDPRAGHVDAYIPQLKPDFNLLADALQSVGAVAKVRKVNRQRIYRLASQLRDVGQGFYPLAVPTEFVDDNVEVPDSEVEKAMERLQKFQENLVKPNQVEDDEEDIDLRITKKSYSKKKRLSKKKKLLAAKKAEKRGRKRLSRKERKILDKRERGLALKRKQAVEDKLKLVAKAAGIPKNVITASSPATVEKISKGGVVQGFAVSPVTQKAKQPSATSSVEENGFEVESTKSLHPGKKRKNTEIITKPFKKKKSSFTVTDFKSPSRVRTGGEKFSIDKGTNEALLKTEARKFSAGQTKKHSDNKFSQGEEKKCSTGMSNDNASKNMNLGQNTSSKEGGISTNPKASEKSASELSESVGKNTVPAIPCATNGESPLFLSSDKATASDSDKTVTERIATPGKNKKIVTQTLVTPGKNKTVTQTLATPGKNKKTVTQTPGENKTVTQILTTPGKNKKTVIPTPGKNKKTVTPTPGKNKKTVTQTLGENKTVNKILTTPGENKTVTQILTTPGKNKKTVTSTPGKNKTVTQTLTTPGKNKKTVTQTSTPDMDVKATAPNNASSPESNSTGDTSLVLNFSDTNQQKGFEDDTKSSQKSPWDEPLQDGEFEIFVRSKRQMKRDKHEKLQKAKKKLSKKGCEKARTISINLRENKEHDYSDYARTLKASPSIPFNASLQPKAPVLKPSPSPILVRKPLLKKIKSMASSASPKFRRGKRPIAMDFF